MKVVITNVFGPGNKGDFALFGALLKELSGYDIDLRVLTNDVAGSGKSFPGVRFYEQIGFVGGAKEGTYYFKKVFFQLWAIVATFLKPAALLLSSSQRKSLEQLKTADLVLGCPGGYLEDSRLSLYTQIVQLLIPALLGKRLILAPMSIGPVRDFTLSRLLLRIVLKRCEKIFIREKFSKTFCESLGVSCELSSDLAFSSFVRTPNQDGGRKEWLAVTLVNWNFPGHDDVESMRERYVCELVRALELLYQVYLLPVAIILQVSTDLPIVERFRDKIQVPCQLFDNLESPDEVKAVLKKSIGMVASRFHSAIFSLEVGCPVLALAYLPKTCGMLKLYGLEDLCLPIESFLAEDVYKKLQWQIEHPEEVVRHNEIIYDFNETAGRRFSRYLANCLPVPAGIS